MAVTQEKNKKKWTNDGRSLYYDVYYADKYGNKKEKNLNYIRKKKMQKMLKCTIFNYLIYF